MNTHDKIELPPLPKGDIAADTCPVMWVHSNAQLQAYARAAIEADRKRRGEPVGYVMPTDMQKLRAGSHALIGPKSQGADIPLYLDPQPAEPVRVPSKGESK